MELPVLVEMLPGPVFRARTGEPLALTAEGATREEALQKLRDLIHSRLTIGVQLLSLEIKPPDNPWMPMAGIYDKDDPLIKEWKQAMAENRRLADEDPDYL
jgi:hypothetical protein